MFVLGVVLTVVALLLILYWTVALKEYKREDDLWGVLLGLPLTAVGMFIIITIIYQLANWRL